MEKTPAPKVMEVLAGKRLAVPPIWLMRQAGRYLPEYRALRARAGGFLEMCYRPEHAIEITMQPIRRFDFDAAILFSDILVIPDALGQQVAFEEGRGPVLESFAFERLVEKDPAEAIDHLKPVIETVAGVRSSLDAEKCLLGFCGAPWTVATYMIAGHGTSDQAPARLYSHQHAERFQQLIDMLADISADYLLAQLQAGADAVQIFDSWAGVLEEDQFTRWCIRPVRRMVDRVRTVMPGARIIGFPKGAGAKILNYRQETGVDAVGLDWTVDSHLGRKVQAEGAVQGNLDPTRLVAGGDALAAGIDTVLANYGDGPLIFNLGHGITPDTPIEHVEALIRRVRTGR